MFSTKKSIPTPAFKAPHLVTGAKGESEAIKYLKSKGYKILEINYRTKAGEIDIIVEKGPDLHFVEVKTRRGAGFGHAVEAVTLFKQRKLIRAAQFYLQYKPEYRNKGHLFSILTLMGNNEKGWEIEFFPNAFGLN
ncbi:YraN family protein [bacterium]|nr:YraN family protein [bacterium]